MDDEARSEEEEYVRRSSKELLQAIHNFAVNLKAWGQRNPEDAGLAQLPEYIDRTISAMLISANHLMLWKLGDEVEDDDEQRSELPMMRSEPRQSFRVVRESKRFDDKRE